MPASVTYKLVLSAAVITLALSWRAWVDALLIFVVTVLLLIAALFNSALEAICDFMETRHNEKIKLIKDIAAAGAGVSRAVWMVVLGMDASRRWQAGCMQ